MVSLEDHDMVGKKVYWDLFEWKLVRSIIAYWNVRLNRESMDRGDPLSVSVLDFQELVVAWKVLKFVRAST